LIRKIFWKPKFNPNYKIKKKEVMEGAKYFIEKSLKIRLRSDKKIGFMLSGGIDSSYLASLAQKKFNQEIETYSVINDDIKYNEKSNIQEILKNLRCKSYFVKPNKNFFYDLKVLIKYHESPISTISYLLHSYLPKKMKSRNIRVAISGTGADEIFSGYYHHFQLFLKTIKNKKIFNKNLVEWRKYIKPLIRNENLKDESIIFNNVINKNFSRLIKNSYNYSKDILRNKMMNEMFHEVVPVILKHDDNNCMMQSIENRSPYLDKDLFEFMNTVPSEYLIENGYQKNILRHVSNKILINSVRLDRKKVGFNASIEEMVDVRDKKFIKKYIEKNEFINDILDKKKLIDILNHTKINDELNKMLFAIISSYTFLELN
jgi:asparagine synthase (glutamine-hydrolysing)